jgi:hypothetical protein
MLIPETRDMPNISPRYPYPKMLLVSGRAVTISHHHLDPLQSSLEISLNASSLAGLFQQSTRQQERITCDAHGVNMHQLVNENRLSSVVTVV